MKQSPKTNKQKDPTKITHLQLKTTLLLLILVTTACVTTSKRDQKIVHTLNAQYELLENIKNQRLDFEVARKVSGDDALSQAERHLQYSIEALMESNNTIREVMQHD